MLGEPGRKGPSIIQKKASAGCRRKTAETPTRFHKEEWGAEARLGEKIPEQKDENRSAAA